MIQPRDETHRALKRMLSNGPLTAVPKRLSDQHLLVALAAAQFEMGKVYCESEINEKLLAWLETFCEPDGLDHVTLRRMLVDSRLLIRTKSGSTYELNHQKLAEVAAVGEIDPRAVLEEIRGERESRKRTRDHTA
jgi:hypothetical protein